MKRNYFNLHSLRRACLTGALVLTAMVASAQSTVIKGNVKMLPENPLSEPPSRFRVKRKQVLSPTSTETMRLQFPRLKQRSRFLIWAQRHRLFPLKEKLP